MSVFWRGRQNEDTRGFNEDGSVWICRILFSHASACEMLDILIAFRSGDMREIGMHDDWWQ